MQKLKADIGIIAAGPAGLCAAVAAAEKGASVIVFEKAANAGGTANMGMGPLGLESRQQREHLINITKEEAFKTFMNFVHWHSDARLMREYYWKSGDTINWLEDMGVNFYGPMRYSPDSQETWHVVQPDDGSRPGGRAAASMTKVIYNRAVELGVEFHFGTPVKKILGDKSGVHGLYAVETATGEEYELESKAVIVATGGFGANPEMVRQYAGFTTGSDMFPLCGPDVVGEGIRMAWEVGAKHGRMEMEGIDGQFLPMQTYHFMDLFAQGNLVVNKSGYRICDESIMQNTAIAFKITDYQQDKIVWHILDDKLVKYYRKHGLDILSEVRHTDPTENFEESIADAAEHYPKYCCIADSPEELAEKMGVDVQNFLETLDEYNDTCDANFDDYFCKPRMYLKAYRGKKWYAIAKTCGAYGSLGGIKTNWKLEVITDEYKPIPGFYGAGTDINETYDGTYMFYLPGNTMGFAVNTGRMAGERAADWVFDHEE